jgi:hypothetical protein
LVIYKISHEKEEVIYSFVQDIIGRVGKDYLALQ